MDFGSDTNVVRWGERVGFVFSYFVFTTILFLILSYLGKFSGTYYVLMTITLGIALVGYLLKRYVL